MYESANNFRNLWKEKEIEKELFFYILFLQILNERNYTNITSIIE